VDTGQRAAAQRRDAYAAGSAQLRVGGVDVGGGEVPDGDVAEVRVEVAVQH
jgi:hypothetical protein